MEINYDMCNNVMQENYNSKFAFSVQDCVLVPYYYNIRMPSIVVGMLSHVLVHFFVPCISLLLVWYHQNASILIGMLNLVIINKHECTKLIHDNDIK